MYTHSIIVLKIARKIKRNVDFPGFFKLSVRLSVSPHRKLRFRKCDRIIFCKLLSILKLQQLRRIKLGILLLQLVNRFKWETYRTPSGSFLLDIQQHNLILSITFLRSRVSLHQAIHLSSAIVRNNTTKDSPMVSMFLPNYQCTSTQHSPDNTNTMNHQNTYVVLSPH